ncbi:hypothetical protein DSO57_1020879 [Entomophthora muscae]|uniref:Uncharacterized protein n=2 Tax=Entomophthora muscae TaxID=34485 RepID=A0ACC2RET4_9FUNG|nr:hypothetical protein DSO57_1033393 [Entomophthora muscae]KAJ9057618.1 hypothetical protein DSO57_1020879 [Entomophthora muscae]
MMAYLGLFAPVLERLAFVAVKVAVNSMAATWPTLYMPMPSDSFSNFPLQVICLLTILTSIFCYTTIGSKMLNLSSQFGLLLAKQLTICLLLSGIFLTTLWFRTIFCQFPLIGETAAGSRGQKTRIKNKNFNSDRFYTPSAGRAAGCLQTAHPTARRLPAARRAWQLARAHQPASPGAATTRQPVPHPGCQMGKFPKGETQKPISPNLNEWGTAAQIWNFPNLGGADKLLKPSIPALTAEFKIGCMKASNDTPDQCKPRDNNLLPAHHYQFPSQKGIPDNTKCLGFPVQCFTLFMPPQG